MLHEGCGCFFAFLGLPKTNEKSYFKKKKKTSIWVGVLVGFWRFSRGVLKVLEVLGVWNPPKSSLKEGFGRSLKVFWQTKPSKKVSRYMKPTKKHPFRGVLKVFLNATNQKPPWTGGLGRYITENTWYIDVHSLCSVMFRIVQKWPEWLDLTQLFTCWMVPLAPHRRSVA